LFEVFLVKSFKNLGFQNPFLQPWFDRFMQFRRHRKAFSVIRDACNSEYLIRDCGRRRGLVVIAESALQVYCILYCIILLICIHSNGREQSNTGKRNRK